jgi:hypothetical protein
MDGRAISHCMVIEICTFYRVQVAVVFLEKFCFFLDVMPNDHDGCLHCYDLDLGYFNDRDQDHSHDRQHRCDRTNFFRDHEHYYADLNCHNHDHLTMTVTLIISMTTTINKKILVTMIMTMKMITNMSMIMTVSMNIKPICPCTWP